MKDRIYLGLHSVDIEEYLSLVAVGDGYMVPFMAEDRISVSVTDQVCVAFEPEHQSVIH